MDECRIEGMVESVGGTVCDGWIEGSVFMNSLTCTVLKRILECGIAGAYFANCNKMFSTIFE
jgi:hypothetical protein